MDNIRVILWALFASLLYISYTVWQQDYAPAPIPQTVENETATAAEQQAANLLPPAGSADLPAAPITAAAQPGGQTAGGKPAPQAAVIQVKTDVFDLDISEIGGSLVRADLTVYPLAKDQPDIPVRLLSSEADSFYQLRSGLRNAVQSDKPEATHLATFGAAKNTYEIGADEELVVPLLWENDGIRVEKTYTFKRGSYAIDLDYKITNTGTQPYPMFSYLQLQRLFKPVERSMFNVDTYSYDGPVVYDGDSYEKLDVDDLLDEPLTATYVNGWLAAIQHHFLTAAVPAPDQPANFNAAFDGKNYTLTSSSPVVTVAPGQTETVSSKFFIGPKLQGQLADTAKGLPLTVDYGILSILAQPLFWVLQQVQKLVVNWGWTIIIVTFLIKLVFYKLTEASGRSMAKMRKLQPRLKALQDRYKDDRQQMSAALMDLYKREKVNPAAGCLPMLVQIPFFIAFYWVLLESVEMRQAPFMLWITDLSSRDPYFVLPLLMGAAMFIQQKLNPAPPDPVQAKVMSILPVVFTVFFAFFPSGLVLYWLTNSVLSILQQWKINKTVAAESD